MLVDVIGTRMPANQPGRCAGDSAPEVASFILDGLTREALRCEAVGPAPRRLRLLTRREYRNTVRDLLRLGAGSGASCARATDCPFGEACAAGSCRQDACDRPTFAFDPGGRALSSVHLAGTFNGWAATIADGGWALEREPASGLWVGSFALAPGSHAYELGAGRAGLDRRSTRARQRARRLRRAELDDRCGLRGRRGRSRLGRRAFRRPLEPDEIERYGDLVAGGATFTAGAEDAIAAMLISPSFLYRSEVGAKRTTAPTG